MIGRPKEFDRDTAIRGAMETFWRHGYEATSVADLVEATGINRGSMYDTFGSKHELFVEALEQYATSAAERTRAALESSDGTPLENIRSFFSHMEDMLFGDGICVGCFMTNTAIELAQHDPEIAGIMKKKFIGLEAIFTAALDRAIAAGEIPPDAPTAKLAAFLVSNMHGAVVSAKAGASRRKVHDSFAIALSALTS